MQRNRFDIFRVFPLQLFISHVVNFPLLLLPWIVIVGLSTSYFGNHFGLPSIILSPEYFGSVSPLSFAMLGFAMGLFLVLWQMVSYLLHSNMYPFLAATRWPIAVFFLNNATIPIFSVGIHCFCIYSFQSNAELIENQFALLLVFAYLTGIFAVLILSVVYFTLSNQDLHKDFAINSLDESTSLLARRGRSLGSNVKYYLTRRGRWQRTRDVSHYNFVRIHATFLNHHWSAFFIQLVVFIFLIVAGAFNERAFYDIPAGASLLLSFSVLVSIIGFFTYWTRRWALPIVIVLLLLFDWFSKTEGINTNSHALGLNYNGSKAEYSLSALDSMASEEHWISDAALGEEMLNNWLENYQSSYGEIKPKVVILSAAGGGMKSGVFTFKGLQILDSLSNDKVSDHTLLMSGASGGMYGLSYWRELLLRDRVNNTRERIREEYVDDLSQDMLNKWAATVASNDLFLPWNTTVYQGQKHAIDRGIAFEESFNENTRGYLEKPLSDYAEPEYQGLIPRMFLSTHIINDGRVFYLNPHPIRYLMRSGSPSDSTLDYETDAIDFGSFFANQGGRNIRFISAIRMNASFPNLFPAVALPSKPETLVMDAGVRDNHGIEPIVRFLYAHKEWIHENTSGVILVQFRTTLKHNTIDDTFLPSYLTQIIQPFGNIVSNLTKQQDYKQDYMIAGLQEAFGDKLDWVQFVLPNGSEYSEYDVPLSLRLSQVEKKRVFNALAWEENTKEFQRLIELIQDK